MIRLFQLTDWPQHKWGLFFWSPNLRRHLFIVERDTIDFYRKRIGFRQALGSVTGRRAQPKSDRVFVLMH